MNWIDYREKLGIGFNDENKTIMLRNKIANFLQTQVLHGSIDFYEDSLYLYFDMVGETRGFSKNPPAALLADSICSSETIQELISKYVALINTYKNPPYNPYEQNNYKDVIKGFFLNALETSKIPFQIFEDSDGFFVFPKGAEELDHALVSEPVAWLKDYPQTHKTFCIALKQYSDGIYIRDVADNLRKTLEDFFKEFLGNTKNLANNKTEVFRYLNDNNSEHEVASMFQALINSYDTLNNKVAKHHDKVDARYLEFLLYQTGIFIRLLITVKKSSEETANAN